MVELEFRFNYQIGELVYELRQDKYRDVLIEIADRADVISKQVNGPGAGLVRGTLIDMTMSELIQSLDEFQPCHQGQSDLMAFGHEYSWKALTGKKGQIALFWSKNGDDAPIPKFDRHIIILVLQEGRWYDAKYANRRKRGPVEGPIIKRGIYVCDMDHANEHVQIGSNNKTDALVDEYNLHGMLEQALFNGWFVSLPQRKRYDKFSLVFT